MSSVFSYKNYRSFLKDTLAEKTKAQPLFSLRAFARHVGMSPSYLSLTLSGNKLLSAAAARKISLALEHSPEEADYFLSLVELEGATESGRRRIHKRMLSLGLVERDVEQEHPEREFCALSLSINKEDLPRAKELIRQFVSRFHQELEAKPGDSQYQLTVQFFRPPAERNRG